MDIIDFYRLLGADANEVVHRFGDNRTLLERFIKKFPQDTSYSSLLEASQENNLQGLERSAHTLKGTAANLGFNSLSEQCNKLVSALRSGRHDDTELLQLQNTICEEYHKVLEAIAQL